MSDWRNMTKEEADAILAQPYVHPEPPTPERNGHAKAASKPRKSKASGERFNTLNTFIDFTFGDLTLAETKTWFVLYRDTRNGKAQSSIRSISKRTKISRQHIHKAITRLLEMGLIERLQTGGFNRGASAYRVKAFPLPDDKENAK